LEGRPQRELVKAVLVVVDAKGKETEHALEYAGAENVDCQMPSG
jgi:hypothetical protein